MKKVAVVSVVKNAENLIENTIRSVLMQNFYDFEYWIMDGLSTDHTMDIIKKYEPEFEQAGKTYHYVSKADNGVADATNSSIDYLDSKYVIFLNVGDYFASDDVLSTIFNDKTINDDIIYGNYYSYYKNFRKVTKAAPIDEIVNHMICTHQAIFTKVELLKKRRYNSREYRMAADYDFYLEMYHKKKSFRYVDKEIVYFEISGISQANASLTQHERFRIQYIQNHLSEKQYKKLKGKIWKICLRKRLVNCLPEFIRYRSYERFDVSQVIK